MKKNPSTPYNNMKVDAHHAVGTESKPKTRCVCNWAIELEDGIISCELPPEGGLIFLSEKEEDKTEKGEIE